MGLDDWSVDNAMEWESMEYSSVLEYPIDAEFVETLREDLGDCAFEYCDWEYCDGDRVSDICER
jgi:hypothetical protein